MTEPSDHSQASDYERIKRVISFLTENAQTQPTLEQAAEVVGLSPAHLQRMFRRWAGISPKRFIQHLTSLDAKRLLRDSTAVLETAFAVGMSGPGRLHDLIVAVDAMTPGEYKRFGEGTTIKHGVAESPFGHCFIGTTDRGICTLRFADISTSEQQIHDLAEEWPGAILVEHQSEIAALGDAIFSRERSDDLLLNLKGTNFQLKVWEGLLRVPERSVVSYGELAQRLGCPNATRAVASAIASNPVGYLIPCHRVIRSTGAVGEYRWGSERKVTMLARETMVNEEAGAG